MAISLHTGGTWVAATAVTQTVTLPTHSTGDMLILRVGFKHATMPTTVTVGTAGWAKVATEVNGTGGASSNGGGGVQVAAFYKEAASGAETNPVVTFNGGAVAATPSGAVAIAYQKGAGESWVTPEGAGTPIAAATSISETIASHVSTTSGDLVDMFLFTNDNTTHSVPTFTQTGVTFDTVAELPTAALTSATSNDISADGCYRIATAGTSSAAAVITGTNSVADLGAGWTTRLRVVAADPITVTPGVVALTTATFAPTLTISAHVTVTPGVASLALTGFAPTVTTAAPTPYWDVLEGLSPTVHLRMQEASGNFADAMVGNDGTAGGSPTYQVTGPAAGIPYGVSLDSGDTITIADGTDVDLTNGPFTILFWLRKTVTTNTTILKKADGTTGPGYTIAHVSSNMRLQDGATSNRLRQNSVDTATTWELYTFVWVGSASSLFELNATDDTNVTSSVALTDNALDLVIGGSQTFEMAGLAIWDGTALTTAQIQTIYDARDVAAADPITVTPGVTSLTLATFAPTVTVSDHQLVTPDATALALSTFAPTVTATNHVTVTPDAAVLTTATFAPTATASAHVTVTPGVASLTTATFAPAVTATAHQTVTPDAVALALSTFAPSLATSDHKLVTVPVASLATATFAPSLAVSDHQSVTVPAASLVTATFAPSVATTAHVTIVPGVTGLTLTPFAPSVSATAHVAVTVPVASLTLATFAPTVTAGGSAVITPDPAALTLSTFAPSVTAGGSIAVTVPAVALTLTAFAPSLIASDHKLLTVPAVSLTTATFAPTIGLSDHRLVTPDAASLSMTAFAPSLVLTDHLLVTPATAALALTAFAPTATVGFVGVIGGYPPSAYATTSAPHGSAAFDTPRAAAFAATPQGSATTAVPHGTATAPGAK